MIAAVIVMALILLLVIYVALAIKIVQQHEQGLIERFGRYRDTVGPGFHMIVPFIEKMKKVDMREQVVDVPPQEVITKDNVVVTVDAVVYYQATDPVKLKYNVSNFILAATKLAQTNLRNVIGDMDLDGALEELVPLVREIGVGRKVVVVADRVTREVGGAQVPVRLFADLLAARTVGIQQIDTHELRDSSGDALLDRVCRRQLEDELTLVLVAPVHLSGPDELPARRRAECLDDRD
jgi:hypothetical protein